MWCKVSLAKITGQILDSNLTHTLLRYMQGKMAGGGFEPPTFGL